jgi:hypothetical protein
VIVELQDARVRRIGRVKSARFVDAEAHCARIVPLDRDPPRLKKRSIGEKDVDAAPLSIGEINGAASIYRDTCGVAHALILKGLQGCALGFKFVDESSSRVSEENIAERIGCERNRVIQLARAWALFSPGIEEFEGGRRLRFGRGCGAISAGSEKK